MKSHSTGNSRDIGYGSRNRERLYGPIPTKEVFHATESTPEIVSSAVQQREGRNFRTRPLAHPNIPDADRRRPRPALKQRNGEHDLSAEPVWDTAKQSLDGFLLSDETLSLDACRILFRFELAEKFVRETMEIPVSADVRLDRFMLSLGDTALQVIQETALGNNQ